MIIMNWHDINEAAVAHVGKPAVYIANHMDYNTPGEDALWEFVVEQVKQMFGKDTIESLNVISQTIHGGLFFFEIEEEAWKFYKIFEHPLTDSGPIYAAFYKADGKCWTENT